MNYLGLFLLPAMLATLTVAAPPNATITTTTTVAQPTVTPLYSMCDPSVVNSTCGRFAECVQVPGCTMGVCRCRETLPNGQRFYATSNGIDCDSVLALGAKCPSGDDGTFVLPQRTECSSLNKTVVCETSLVQLGPYECGAPANWVSTLDGTCTTNGSNDCNHLLGLECNKTKCSCIRGRTWNGKSCEVTPGQECGSHNDCQFGYGEMSVCVHNGRCVCAAGSKPVLYAQLSTNNQRKFFVNNYCASDRSPMNALNGNCTVPGYPTGPRQFCGRGLVCHHCPEFGTFPDDGRCLNLTSSAHESVRTRIYTSATVEGLCSPDSRPRK